MFYSDINPVLVSLGPFAIRWYGVIFVFGIFLTYFVFRYLARQRGLPLSGRDFDDLLVFGVVGVVVGARLGSVLSGLSDYVSNPLEVFAVWHGGMAFHGGLAGLVVAGLLYCRAKRVSFYSVADLVAVPAPLALAFGRLANFINGEFYGTVTSLPWGVKFAGVEGFRHPVQVYEAVLSVLIFLVLWRVVRRSLPAGFVFWLFILLYSIGRFFAEFYKDLPSLFLGMTWGQLWSVSLFFAAAAMLIRLMHSARKPHGITG